MKVFRSIIVISLISASTFCVAQNPSTLPANDSVIISSAPGVRVIADTIRNTERLQPVHSPRKATLRSAIIPGWGQAYNKQYWKIPLVYAVIGIPAGTYFYNNSWYNRSKFAYETKIANDTPNFSKINPRLEVYSNEDLRFLRNEFRRSRDYSILYTLLAWGLNVVDATVSGHLKEFDVSDDLSMKINPVFSPGSNTKGISLVFAFKNTAPESLRVR
jgi:hypothetical protein